MSIRAWQVHALGDAADVLTLGDIERPTPGPDQVRVRVRATGVNFADTLLCRGEYQVKPSPPFVPGLEVCGDVVEVGERVTHVAVGDRVLGGTALPHGGYAQECLLDGASTEPTATPSATASAEPSGEPSSTPTATPTRSGSVIDPEPTASPTASPTTEPSAPASASAIPTASPSASSRPTASASATATPSRGSAHSGKGHGSTHSGKGHGSTHSGKGHGSTHSGKGHGHQPGGPGRGRGRVPGPWGWSGSQARSTAWPGLHLGWSSRP